MPGSDARESRNRRRRESHIPVLPAAVRSDAHRRADHIHLLREDRVNVGFDRVEPRRNEHTRRIGPLLMHVVNNFRMPEVVKLRDSGARFRLCEKMYQSRLLSCPTYF